MTREQPEDACQFGGLRNSRRRFIGRVRRFAITLDRSLSPGMAGNGFSNRCVPLKFAQRSSHSLVRRRRATDSRSGRQLVRGS
jgi:hypothetical protein